MSGLAAPDASIPEKIVAYALPLAAGAAASLHPAGARGLAGLTSAVQTQLQARLIGRQEANEQALGMRLSNLLEQPTGEQIPDAGAFTPTATGGGTDAAEPAKIPTRQQRLSDVLGPAQTGLVRAMTGGPGYGREAAGLLSGMIGARPHYQVIKEYNPDTDQEESVVYDVSKMPSGTRLGGGRPGFFTPEQRNRMAERFTGGQPPAGPGPSVPPPVPSPAVPAPAAPTGQAPTSELPETLTPTPRQSMTLNARGEPSFHEAPGSIEFGTTEMRGPDGRTYKFVQQRDPATGRVGKWVPQGEAAPTDKQSEIEGIADSFNVERNDPRYRQLTGLIAARPSDPADQAVYMSRLYQMFGRRGEQPLRPMPQSGAPQNAPAQPRTPAPAPSYSPTQSGVIPAPPAAPSGGQGLDYLDVQSEAARLKTRQAAERTAAEAAAGVTARTGAERALPMEPKEASNLLMPNGQSVPTGMTRAQAIAAGAREVTPQMREQLAGLDQARAIISGVDSMTKPLIQAKTALGAVRQQAVLQGGALAKTNPLAAMYLDSKQSFNGVLSRAIGGERGVLTDRDIIRITSSLPGFGDTATIRDAKIGMLRILLETATEAQKRVILGSQSLDEARTSIDAKVQAMIQKMEGGAEQGAAAPSQALKSATKEDFARARRDAKGDPQKTIDLLQQRGFDPLLEVK
jgi:hypothetical protein